MTKPKAKGERKVNNLRNHTIIADEKGQAWIRTRNDGMRTRRRFT